MYIEIEINLLTKSWPHYSSSQSPRFSELQITAIGKRKEEQ
jgi:hypothetical protein